MDHSMAAVESSAGGLSQVERVVDTYVAPSKTFMDIHRNSSWWLPFLLSVLVSLAFVYSVDRKIGFDQVAQATINRSAATQQRMSTMSDAQRESTVHLIARTTRISSYATPLILLIIGLICAGILMMSFNLGLGAKASFSQYLAVWFYASLPFVIKTVLAAITIFVGGASDQFDMRNPVGTNIGWYLSSDTPAGVKALLSSADLFTIWVVLLLILGCATVARVKRSSAAIVIIGWWILIIVGSTVTAAFNG
jgi:hypothetical protein